MAATNNDLFALLNTIRSEMATKTDIARLHWENAGLRAVNEAQTSQLRCLRTDLVNLRAEVEELRTKLLFELWEGFGETKEDIIRCSTSTQQEIWGEAREIMAKVGDVEDGVAQLTRKEERRDEEAQELNDDFLRVMNRIERVEAKVDVLALEVEVPRKDSGVSFVTEEKKEEEEKEKKGKKQRMKRGLWFADGY